jgi:hypothetical protein
LLCSEIDKVIVICPDFKGFRVPFKVMAKGFKGMDDGEELFVMNIIILFSREEQLGEVSNGVPMVKKVGLFENCTHGKVTCICD